MKTIIVGNGPSVLKKKNGSLIDSFENVVRLNDFKINGYKEYVGKKTNTLFTCRLNEYNSPEEISKFPQVILSLLMNPLVGVDILPEVIAAPNVVANLGWDYCFEVSKAAHIQKPQYASTGLICIYYMIEQGYDVTITGFDNFGPGNKHYYEPGMRKKPTLHNGARERGYIQKLVKHHKLTIL